MRLRNLLINLVLVFIGIAVISTFLVSQAQAQENNQTSPNQCVPLSVDVPEPVVTFPYANEIGTYLGATLPIFGLVNLALAIPIINVIRLLQAAVTEPLLVFFGRRRKAYGTVYKSLSKMPIDLALVRLIDANTGRVVSTKVTDSDGSFTFFVKPGTYKFIVAKTDHIFPSKFLAGEKYDENYGPINTGENFEMIKSGVPDINIPLDSPEDRISIRAALRRHTRRAVHIFLAYAGIILSAIVVVYSWTWWSWLFLFIHVIFFLIFSRLERVVTGRPWGRVYDRSTKQALGRSIVRILDHKFNRVLETLVTDKTGQYCFRVGKSTYRVESIRQDYETSKTKPFTTKQKPAVVSLDVPMQKKIGIQTATPL